MRTARTLIRNLGIFTLWLLPAYLSAAPTQASEPLRAFVSVLPQKHFVEQIGGNQVLVESMVQPGFSHETYEPTAQQIVSLAKARLYVRIGMPFEDTWMKRIQAVNPDIVILDARDGLPLRKMEAHEHEHEHEAAETDKANTANQAANLEQPAELDSHIWTSPRLAKQMLAPLRDKLTSLMPDDAAGITANYEHAIAELDALDKEFTTLFTQHPDKKFMVFHPDLGYFADAYHLTQIAIEFEGKEPGAKALTNLIKQAKAEGIKTIFVEPQFDQRAAQQIAQAIDGKVVAIDPLAEDYVPNLRKIAHLIAGVNDE